MRLQEYPDREMMAVELAQEIAGELNTCLMTHEHASLAVPGGGTPGPVFDVLSAADLDWSRVHVMLTDERWVPEEDERSNTRLVRERLLTGRAAAATLVPMRTDDARPEDAVEALARGLEGELPLSILLTGMGDDMHTASLFPGAEGLGAALDREAPALMAMRPPGQEARMTMTAPVLAGAMTKHVLIAGQAKREAFEKAKGLPPEKAPIAAVWEGASVHWAP